MFTRVSYPPTSRGQASLGWQRSWSGVDFAHAENIEPRPEVEILRRLRLTHRGSGCPGRASADDDHPGHRRQDGDPARAGRRRRPVALEADGGRPGRRAVLALDRPGGWAGHRAHHHLQERLGGPAGAALRGVRGAGARRAVRLHGAAVSRHRVPGRRADARRAGDDAGDLPDGADQGDERLQARRHRRDRRDLSRLPGDDGAARVRHARVVHARRRDRSASASAW